MSYDYHRSCQHKVYKLTCADFDALYAFAGGACQLCGTPEAETKAGRLGIDHDRHYGWAVRGLLCDKCNALMRRVDARERHDSRADRYRHNAWFLHRSVRVEDDLWREAGEVAAEQGTSRAAVMQEALRRFVARFRSS